MKDITLKEIASKLGISITTVSKALKNYHDVSDKTKNAVVALAKELQYTPNSFAVNLRTKESKTIGLIVPELVHHFFSNVVNAIIDEAEKNGYLVIILQSNESLALEKKQIELLINKRVDGIIMSLSNESNNDAHIREIVDRKIPFVMFDKIAKLSKCSKVIINDQSAAFNAVQHLIDVGCKRIAHIRGPINPQNSVDRYIGYKKALEKNNIPFDSTLVYTCEKVNFEEGKYFAEQIINEHADIDGIFAITDLVAVGVLAYLNEKKINIPAQVAVIGFSNWFMSQVLTPKLSTVDQPSREMGIESFNLLLEEMTCYKEGLVFTPKTIELKTRTIIRESSMRKLM
ncbi:transcriptional regulator, LacI family [Flavobacterium micromati]|jgi:LacI family transcriptional regulator|uniref:Transcriptional regulator, LacI family n=1 Tax=Flavobacterium micromati TaxID=229205 RepID=A0A1M5FGZ3_9FLAO|nr:LacI family DNA-binding transcriptional regulator [Flavobacterium micromati]MCL6460574.1 LacI family DNA-binding transcriptional regulator [Flavobacterium micromati]SHF90748.1 transcriptional regulator, LacI family [Flavobacterium micromati]